MKHADLPSGFTEYEGSVILKVWELNGIVLEKYHEADRTIEKKSDGSPVTEVDLFAHEEIVGHVNSFGLSYPVVSEENFQDVPEVPSDLGTSFWLIDPIDGTKGFISRNGQFAICVAFIEENAPQFGVIAIPAEKSIYFARKGGGAFCYSKKKGLVKLPSKHQDPGFVHILMSKSRSQFDEDELERHRIKIYRISSAVKFCYLAEGGFDAYVRKGPTYEWDTAAGQCIIEESGAKMTGLDGSLFSYGKEKFLNGPFLVTRQDEDIEKLQKTIYECLLPS